MAHKHDDLIQLSKKLLEGAESIRNTALCIEYGLEAEKIQPVINAIEQYLFAHPEIPFSDENRELLSPNQDYREFPDSLKNAAFLLRQAVESQTTPELADEKPQEPNSDDKPLTPAIERAYQSYCWGEKTSGFSTDKEVFGYLKDNPLDDYEIPAFDTWARYVGKGRKHYGTHKNTLRAGRTVRAGNATEDPGLLKQISNQQ